MKTNDETRKSLDELHNLLKTSKSEIQEPKHHQGKPERNKNRKTKEQRMEREKTKKNTRRITFKKSLITLIKPKATCSSNSHHAASEHSRITSMAGNSRYSITLVHIVNKTQQKQMAVNKNQ